MGLSMDHATRLKRMKFRAWHRGTKEADLLIGGFLDTYGETWSDEEIAWYEMLMQEEDVEIMAWAIGTLPVPERYEGPMMQRMQALDYIPVAK
jgi:antitoxin CptB